MFHCRVGDKFITVDQSYQTLLQNLNFKFFFESESGPSCAALAVTLTLTAVLTAQLY